MAQDAANSIVFFICVGIEQKEALAAIRQWANLKMAADEKEIWVKDLDHAQVHSLEVKSIPYKRVYYSKDGKLYPDGSLLPERAIPNLLWTAIDRALPVTLPSFNHNYFGMQETIAMRLVPAEVEQEAEAMRVSIRELKQYIETAPAIRLQPLTWTLLNNNEALIVGKPLLPIKGEVYWKQQQALLPAGYDFELSSLTKAMNELIDPGKENLVTWHVDGTYALIDTEDLRPLSLSSFRQSIKHQPLEF